MASAGKADQPAAQAGEEPDSTPTDPKRISDACDAEAEPEEKAAELPDAPAEVSTAVTPVNSSTLTWTSALDGNVSLIVAPEAMALVFMATIRSERSPADPSLTSR